MTSYFQHAKFKVPVAHMRNAVGSFWRKSSALTGQYEPMSPSEVATVDGSPVPFRGDIPKYAGTEHQQTRKRFAEPRPLLEEVENLIVTPLGGGWHDNCLFERYSSCKPGLRMLLENKAPTREVETGYVIQSEHVDTFGDWTSEYLTPLAGIANVDGPVFLPAAFAQKGYVRRDMARTSIDFQFVDAPILIKRAKVIRQQMYIRYWTPEYAQNLRRLLGAQPVSPKRGSMIYLSRHGEPSEVAVRTHPNLLIEKIVKDRGGIVLRTDDSSLEDYLAAGEHAETVLLDHGSAGYNLSYWQPKRVIEFVSDQWWMNSFLFFATSIGVPDYGIICTDQGSDDEIAKRLTDLLETPIA
ncbi:hypothetical protein [Hyphococcus sp. DH-69]|uniref:hypothetical protein n=1 Tax=Hyphococcus formosus TaxID=3143534 RepID=UPI00398B56DB